jgi:sulfoxide reductase heme-binding subunit YedZ
MQQHLINLQKFLIQNKSIITNTFLLIELLILGNAVVIGFFLAQQRLDLIDVYDLGKWFGLMALVWYTLSLLPGMITRFRWQPTMLIGTMLMLFRRHVGIMMFLSALSHYLFTTIYYFTFSGITPFLAPGPTAGWIAFLTAIPLWVTSNSFAERKLGKWWKRIHRLTYVILLLVFAHLFLVMTKWAWLGGAVLVLEVLSWAVAWRRQRQSTARPVASSTVPVSQASPSA